MADAFHHSMVDLGFRIVALLALVASIACTSGPADVSEVPRVCPASMKLGDICVDPRIGSDDSGIPGTADKPVKTVTHALTLVGVQGAGRTVYLLPGTYDVAGGETLPINIATGITVEGVAPVDADTLTVAEAAVVPAALILGEGAVMVMHPGATLKRAVVISQGTADAGFLADGATFGVQLEETFFGGTITSPFVARGGEITAIHVGLGPQLSIERTAIVTGDHLALTLTKDSVADLRGQVSIETGSITFDGGGTLDLQGSLIGRDLTMTGHLDGWPDAGDHDPPYVLVLRDDASILDLTGGSIDGVFVGPRSSPNLSTFHASAVDFNHSAVYCPDSGCKLVGGTYTDSKVGGAADVSLTSAHFQRTLIGFNDPNGRNLVIRGCTFSAGSHIVIYNGDLDLGTISDPGHNIFEGEPGIDDTHPNQHPTFVNMDHYSGNHVPWAIGNRWLPNEGPADANGNYPPGFHSNLDDKNIVSRIGAYF